MKWSESCSVMSSSLQPHGLYSPWNSPDQNTQVVSFSLLQGIFPTQGSNPGLPHCRRILYLLSHKGIPRILEWVTYSFSRGSSWPRNRSRVSCFAGGFFTNQAIREALKVKVAQSYPSLFGPMDYTVHGFLQARILEWVAFPFSRGSSQPRDWSQVSVIAGGFFTSRIWVRAMQKLCTIFPTFLQT